MTGNHMPRLLLAILLFSVYGTTQTTFERRDRGSAHIAQPTNSPQSSLPSVFELLLTRYRFETDGTGSREVIGRIRILNQMGIRQRAEETFEYRPLSEELQIRYVRVRKKGGTLVNVETNVVQRPPNDSPPQFDYDEKRVRVPNLDVGDLLEYDAVIVIHRPLGPREFVVQHNFQPSVVIDERLDVDLPRNCNVKVKTVPTVKFWQTPDNARRVYHWESRNAQSHQIGAIPYIPGRAPDVQVSSFANWEELGRWYSELEKPHRMTTPDVKSKADELTKGLSSDIEKTEALYDYVAKKIKYISLVSLGIGGYEPHSASETIQRGYGDCKDKTALLRALLEAEGLHASSVLISGNRKLDLDIPSPWFFDHAMAVLQVGSEEIWMDPSSSVLPFRMLPYQLRGKQVLVILTDGAPQFEKTPAEPPIPSSLVDEIEGVVSKVGTLDAIVNITARGDEELSLRQAFVGPVESVWPFTVEGVIKGIDRKADKVSDVKITEPTSTNEPFRLSFRISKPLFLDVSKPAIVFNLPLTNLSLPSAEEKGITDALGDWHRLQSEPVNLGPTRYSTYRATLQFADQSATPATPQSVTLSRDYALYKATFRVEHTSFVAEQTLNINKSELPTQRREDYRDFREKVLENSEQRIHLQVADGTKPEK